MIANTTESAKVKNRLSAKAWLAKGLISLALIAYAKTPLELLVPQVQDIKDFPCPAGSTCEPIGPNSYKITSAAGSTDYTLAPADQSANPLIPKEFYEKGFMKQDSKKDKSMRVFLMMAISLIFRQLRFNLYDKQRGDNLEHPLLDLARTAFNSYLSTMGIAGFVTANIFEVVNLYIADIELKSHRESILMGDSTKKTSSQSVSGTYDSGQAYEGQDFAAGPIDHVPRGPHLKQIISDIRDETQRQLDIIKRSGDNTLDQHAYVEMAHNRAKGEILGKLIINDRDPEQVDDFRALEAALEELSKRASKEYEDNYRATHPKVVRNELED